mmetsp:Transcript_104627/g.145860  ORF Transcript_104627/g.145860 Transcript_104627/m.145860 type:complete len:244 (+) Transcript_104627:898-1629(+)
MKKPICLEDLGHETSHLGLVHLPNLSELLLVGLLEVLKLLLQVLELFRQALVLFCELVIVSLVLLVQGVVPTHQGIQSLPKSIQAVFVRRLDGSMLLVPFRKNLEVVLQLLLVEEVCCNHLLQVLLQFLNTLFQCNFTLIVSVGIVRSELFYLLLESSFALLPSFEEFILLHLSPLLKQCLYFCFILLQHLFSLILKRLFDIFQLFLVMLSECVILLPHLRDEGSDVHTLLLEHLDVLLILVF